MGNWEWGIGNGKDDRLVVSFAIFLFPLLITPSPPSAEPPSQGVAVCVPVPDGGDAVAVLQLISPEGTPTASAPTCVLHSIPESRECDAVAWKPVLGSEVEM